MIQRDLVIVGAGPAGMAAAVTACRAGLGVTLIDENPLAGGQIYRQPPEALAGLSLPTDESAVDGTRIIRELETLKDQIEWLPKTSIWGYFPDRKLALRSDHGWQIIAAKQIILAPGAYEFAPPFPGWTLPGVMTPGAAQSLVKTMKTLPGRRVLVAGSGPFLLVVAWQLHAAGAEVVGVVETARRRDFFRNVPALLSDPGLLFQGRRYFRQLKDANIPLYWGHLVTAATGDDCLKSVTVSTCDAQGKPQADQTSFAVDTLCVGYGFIPRIEVAQMAACEMKYCEIIGGWVPEVDDTLETSVSGVRVAGDGGGVAGAVMAEIEGKVAALAAAHQLGTINRASYTSQLQPLARRLTKLRKFRSALDQIYSVRPGVFDLALPETTLCRCEEVSRQEIEEGIEYGGTNISTLKVITRVGMGPCQGKMCWPTVARLIAARKGTTVADVGAVRVRPPIGQLEMADLLTELPLDSSHETA